MNIYDTITADSVEVGDQIIINGDPVEVTAIHDDGVETDVTLIEIAGYSHNTGDTVFYTVGAWDLVDLWAV